MVERRAIVVGAGIGGLAAAAALLRQGWAVTVHERASALEQVGAGLGIAPNGLRVLDRVGAGEAVRDLSALQGDGGIRRADGRWLAHTSMEAVSRRVGDIPFVVARRGDLIEILRALLPDGALRLGSEVREVDPGDDRRPARVVTDDGASEAELVVAADGIHSGLRRRLLPEHPGPRYSGCTSWRFIVAAPPDGVRPAETWGRGRVFGIMPLTGSALYCYAMTAARSGERAADEVALLARLFGDWHAPIPAVLASVAAADVLRNDVYDLVGLPAFHRGRVALLGDTAHAMMPNLGQGGCQAMEDAAVLAHHVSPPDVDVSTALVAYCHARLGRTRDIARQSRRMMRLSHLSAAPAVLARNLAMCAAGALSADMTARLFLTVAGWRPPGESQPAAP